MLKIAVLISGSGSNLQSIIDNIENGYLNCKIEMVISDRPEAYGIIRAKNKNIDTYVMDRKIYGADLSKKIHALTKQNIDLIVLAGFLSILDKEFIKSYKYKIINIHPSLIPSFCGNGMYGLKVHEKALEYGVKFSGCTVHFVDEGTDTGAIICQRIVPVFQEDTAEKLQKRIIKEEHEALPEVIKLIADKRIRIENRKVLIT